MRKAKPLAATPPAPAPDPGQTLVSIQPTDGPPPGQTVTIQTGGDGPRNRRNGLLTWFWAKSNILILVALFGVSLGVLMYASAHKLGDGLVAFLMTTVGGFGGGIMILMNAVDRRGGDGGTSVSVPAPSPEAPPARIPGHCPCCNGQHPA